MTTPILLMIGATGRMGLQLIRSAASNPVHPQIHAFARTPSKFSPEDAALCASIQEGDATLADDIERALAATRADVVLVSVGVPNSTAPSDVRQKSAEALHVVLQREQYKHVCVVVVSVVGSGGSKIDYGWGVGIVVGWVLRHLLKDHDRQEEILSAFGNRTMIVRPMGLADGENRGVQVFEGRAPKLMVNRKDLAEWVLAETLEGKRFGTAVNVTGST